MRVLVAGDRGYIGAVLMPFLRAAGHEVDGLDLGLYEGCDLGPAPEDAVRAARGHPGRRAGQLAGYDAVMCLAALSNDPLGDLNPAATYSVNLDGTLRPGAGGQAGRRAAVPVRLVLQPVRRGRIGGRGRGRRAVPGHAVRRGQGHGRARSCRELADDHFSPTYLRNATAYGASPRLRLDIVVNNLTAVALTTGQVGWRATGSPWRPLVHIEDICRAFGAVLDAPRELVHDEAFNVGRPEDNVQVREIAEMVHEAVPGSEISFADGAGPDLRNYRVDFSKLNDTFPDLRLQLDRPGRRRRAHRGVHQVRPDLRRFRRVAVRPAARDP